MEAEIKKRYTSAAKYSTGGCFASAKTLAARIFHFVD